MPPPLAVSKWNSAAQNLSWFDLVLSLHSLVSRAWLRAWPSGGEQVAEEAAPEDEWHKEITRRLGKTSVWLSEKDTYLTLPVANIVSYPIDTFIYVVSAADGTKLKRPLISLMPQDRC